MFEFTAKGDWSQTKNFLFKLQRGDIFSSLHQHGQAGVNALARATPVDTGLTQHSWTYKIVKDSHGPGIEWHNTNMAKHGVPVAILIQYGHATGTGGYVHGRDFINPAIQPVFDKIADDVWKKVKSG